MQVGRHGFIKVFLYDKIMAKELPYYKFEPNQWENGNIQICTREDKGLFIDLCSMYWSRLGDVPLKLAIQKLCGGNASAFDSLINEGIFEVINDMICINFLNEQLGEFDNTSKQNSKSAKLRWEKHRKEKEMSERNASALITQCENDAIREDKRIEDNIYSEIDFLKDWKAQRELILKKPTNINKLAPHERTNFLLIKNQNTREEIINGMEGLFRQGNIKFETMTLRPKHFLDHFETYLSAYDEKNSSLYGRKKEVERL